MKKHESPNKYEWPGFFVLCAFLVIRFIYRVATPAGEWPLSPAHYLSMGMDIAIVLALIIAAPRLIADLGPDDHRRVLFKLAFFPAIIAGGLLILIRFQDNQSWWTGHLN